MHGQKKQSFDELREWITLFLEENGGLVANRPTHNLLIAQVWTSAVVLIRGRTPFCWAYPYLWGVRHF